MCCAWAPVRMGACAPGRLGAWAPVRMGACPVRLAALAWAPVRIGACPVRLGAWARAWASGRLLC